MNWQLTMFSATPSLSQTIKLLLPSQTKATAQSQLTATFTSQAHSKAATTVHQSTSQRLSQARNALKSLDEAVKALQTHLTQRGTDIVDIEEELEHAKIEMTRLSDAIATLDREIIRVRRGVKRTQFNIRHIDKYGGKLEREAAAYKGRMAMFRNERNSIQEQPQKNPHRHRRPQTKNRRGTHSGA